MPKLKMNGVIPPIQL